MQLVKPDDPILRRVYAGEQAVVILHEIDHLASILISDFSQPRRR